MADVKIENISFNLGALALELAELGESKFIEVAKLRYWADKIPGEVDADFQKRQTKKIEHLVKRIKDLEPAKTTKPSK